MIDSFLSLLTYFKKPVWLNRPDRFLIFALLLLLSSSCAATKQSAVQALVPAADTFITADTGLQLQPGETTDGVFVDAVKAKMVNNKAEAFKQFSRVAALDSNNATAHFELSRLWLERGNIPKALEEIRYTLKRDSSNKWFYNQYANLLDVDGQYLKAAGIMGKLAGKEKSPEDFLQRQAILLQKAGKGKEALAVLDKLAAYVGQDDESVLLQKQQIYLSDNNLEGAVGEVSKLVGYYPQEPRYLLLKGDLYDNNGKDGEALKVYKQAELKFPDDSNVQFALVQYYLEHKDTTNFQHYLEKVILNKNLSMEDRIGFLAPLLRTRDQDTATKKLAFQLARKLAEQDPKQLEPRLLYADLLAFDNSLDSAAAEYKAIIATDSTKFGAWQQLLLVYTRAQDYDSLLQYSQRAAKLFPEEQMVFYLGGIGYQLRADYEHAETFLKKAISLHHSDDNDELLSEMLTALGDTYNSDKKFESSDSCYRAALALQPDNASALNNFSYYLSERGEHLEEAERMSAKSLTLRPGEATFLDTYGWILYKQGKYPEAKAYIERAIDANKGDADGTLYEHLGDVELKIGNRAKALENWLLAQSKGNKSETLQQKINEQKTKE